MPHTPGPWHVPVGEPRAIRDERGNLVATMFMHFDHCPPVQAAANAELIASAPDLLAQTQRDAAVIAELTKENRRARVQVPLWRGIASAMVERAKRIRCDFGGDHSMADCRCDPHQLGDAMSTTLDSALLAAESRAEAKCEWCDSGNVAPMSRIPSWPGRPLHEVGDGEYVACKRSSSTPAAAAESRAEAGREKAKAPITAEWLLNSLMDACGKENNGFCILDAALSHLNGEPDACLESMACRYFWNQWMGHTTRQDIQDEFHARRAERLKREAAGPEVKS